ncbi:SusD family outer membrane protein [Mucinivorans hirudinis]|uniref:SusD family outer membrane protein n=1 Tax=Mucinivorans hirudinis TaxID=1433126 RepID=A0A060R7X1_9BACT|nr:SusD family outer membrane protein [Mucinivorans hirudinis]
MKTKIITIVLCAIFICSCESFLDAQPIEKMTYEKIWQQRGTTEQYLAHIYSFLPEESDLPGIVWTGASDEIICVWKDSDADRLNSGTWSPTSPAGQRWGGYYRAIREANIFLQAAPLVVENIKNRVVVGLTEEEFEGWCDQVLFLRAFYYAELLKQYGAVILLKDMIIAPDAELSTLAFPRSPWDECVEWVCSELEACAAKLPDKVDINSDYGRPTRSTALAIIARLRLYSARELFNGNSLYANIKNPDGTRLFPDYDPQKWQVAAAAAKKAIDCLTEDGYGLYVSPKTGKYQVYESIKGIFFDHWNNEILWGRWGGAGRWGEHVRPRALASVGGEAYGGASPTQQQVDSYAMANGYYPIVGYEGESYYLNQRTTAGVKGITGRATGGVPTIDPRSGYDESSFSMVENPSLGGGKPKKAWNMYKNREPRFYAAIHWNDWVWCANTNFAPIIFDYSAKGEGYSGSNGSHDFPPSGYLVRKMFDNASGRAAPDYGTYTWPYVRVGEVYLNYCEALVESDPGNPDLLHYLNAIRTRAGVPPIEQIYGSEIKDKAFMRELVRRERRVELAFENHRYFDTRTWMIAQTTDNGNMWGMNIQAPNSELVTTQDAFWKRSVAQRRVFRSNHYLHPFSQYELDRNKNLVQNYGW